VRLLRLVVGNSKSPLAELLIERRRRRLTSPGKQGEG
jgi:hypothetical protein